jgi:glucose-6-phosphate-specific signal transduction histidine kinase
MTVSAGADSSRGSGLRGLVDRVEALDARLDLRSPPGAGTRIRAEIPAARRRTSPVAGEEGAAVEGAPAVG